MVALSLCQGQIYEKKMTVQIFFCKILFFVREQGPTPPLPPLGGDGGGVTPALGSENTPLPDFGRKVKAGRPVQIINF